jgi:hypothetical protein
LAENQDKLVLPVRIELTTSPLPRGCSTTELRQREGGDYTCLRHYYKIARHSRSGLVVHRHLDRLETLRGVGVTGKRRVDYARC